MKHLYLISLSVFLLHACGRPLQVVRVEPAFEHEIDRYRYGNPVQSSTNGAVTVEVSYYDASDNYLVFDTEVVNESDEAILFDPAESYLEFPLGQRISAIDPEFQLLSMDLKSVEQARTARTLAWAGAAVLVAASAYSLANGGGSIPEPTTNATVVADLGFQVADAMTFAVLQRENDILQRNWVPAGQDIPGPDNRYFWLDYSFRKTTLRPGESAVGKLLFPRSDDHPQFQVAVPVDELATFNFQFAQRIFRDRR
ncbi:hypothetical protein CLV84_3459 [Neolewinella xylanilytica]|uniref:Uncharacterized protein n=1 Tax=Neolewinella xylanilytica TaxID=1514080 RepID=A0A2S6I5T7_9BACT|nr:hypothetical protein [Neolewinella xylanilytica]PPK86528.1 hypothetical protein CLV84_3459 [Neolewinella xylanilytica]